MARLRKRGRRFNQLKDILRLLDAGRFVPSEGAWYKRSGRNVNGPGVHALEGMTERLAEAPSRFAYGSTALAMHTGSPLGRRAIYHPNPRQVLELTRSGWSSWRNASGDEILDNEGLIAAREDGTISFPDGQIHLQIGYVGSRTARELWASSAETWKVFHWMADITRLRDGRWSVRFETWPGDYTGSMEDERRFEFVRAFLREFDSMDLERSESGKTWYVVIRKGMGKGHRFRWRFGIRFVLDMESGTAHTW